MNETDTRGTAAIYVRTVPNTPQVVTVRTACVRAAQALQLTPVLVCQDPVGRERSARLGLAVLRSAVYEALVDAVIVPSLSHLSRDPAVLAGLQKDLAAAGIRLYTASHGEVWTGQPAPAPTSVALPVDAAAEAPVVARQVYDRFLTGGLAAVAAYALELAHHAPSQGADARASHHAVDALAAPPDVPVATPAHPNALRPPSSDACVGYQHIPTLRTTHDPRPTPSTWPPAPTIERGPSSWHIPSVEDWGVDEPSRRPGLSALRALALDRIFELVLHALDVLSPDPLEAEAIRQELVAESCRVHVPR